MNKNYKNIPEGIFSYLALNYFELELCITIWNWLNMKFLNGFERQGTNGEFSLKDVANEIKKFEALIKKDLQAKER